MSNLRVTTNLNSDATLQLPKNELRSSFLYLYNRGFKEKPFPFISRMWIGLIAPEVTRDARYGKNPRFIRDAMKDIHKKMPGGLTRLKKINDQADPHFKVSLPIISASTDVFASRMRTFIRAIADQQASDAHDEKANELQMSMIGDKEASEGQFAPRFYKQQEVLANMGGLNTAGLEALKSCLIGVSLEQTGSRSVWFVHLRISKAEAQQLTNSEWQEIRNVDLYPLMLGWAQTSFGQVEGKSPLSSFPISKIARTLPPVTDADIRTDEYGISIAPDGSPLYLPQKLDQTSKYENLFSQAGYNDETDDFALARADKLGIDVAEGSLPRNIPVLIDWVNNKYSFTTTTGMLNVLDLNRYKRADASHIMSLMSNKFLTNEFIGRFVPMAVYAGLRKEVEPTEDELKEIEEFDPVAAATIKGATHDVHDYVREVEKAYDRMNGDDIYITKLTPDSEYSAYRAVYRWCVKAYDAILNQLESVYAHYSVSHVAQQLAWLTIVVKYGAQVPEVSAKDMQIRHAAMNQSSDPNWEIPSCPLIRKENLILPHQKKIRCMLKDSPDFAILPVQAGGGKSFLAITDVLYEIKANRSQPYLILCPPHLVAQYVKEITYFTQGKLNAIAINTYTIRRNGLKRLGKMLETAPRNTVVVVDYDVLRYKAQKVCYGTTNVDVYPIIEFLRQFRFGYALLDESHVVKNASARTRACLSLISDIPKKRLASGTMAHDSPSDLAIQIGMLDPTLFGSRDDFNAKYGEKVSGNRVLQWKPGAQQEIMARLKSRIVVAGAMRKEWAALLPQAEENFHRVDLTEAQREVYNLLFERTLDAIREAAKTSPRLAEFVNGGKTKLPNGEEGELDPDAGDESAQDEFEDEDLAAMLNPYLARLEQFITAPARDELGNTLLKGEDRVSAKVARIHEIMREHMQKGIPGKVLVFTNYTASAEEIYDTLPEDMKSKAILYVASDKIEAGAAFEHDESKLFMIGVEQSMNTGLNLQFASRLIRVETVWNPGTLEQGNSRVNRPELKAESRRTRIYFDWVMADRTIDITKISRLISKIVANAKFENADNPTYESIPDVPVMKMTLQTVQEHNDWGNPDDPESESTLAVYGNAYQEYRQCLYDDYKEYREKHGELKIERIEEGVVPQDARLMHTVPYTPGLEIYGTDQLGLLRVDDYLRLDAMDTSDDDEAGDEDDQAEQADERKRRLTEELVGQIVHTEFGEGVVRSVNFAKRYLRVDFPSGFAKMQFAATFLITRKDTSTKDIRNQLLKETGDIPVDTPIDSPAQSIIQDARSMRIQERLNQEKLKKEKIQKKKELEAQMSIELHVSLINGFLSLSYFPDESTPAATNALQALGFVMGQQFYYARIPNAQRLSKQLALWAENDFRPDPKLKELKDAFTSVHTMLQKGKNTPLMNYKFATQGQLRNFYRMEHKPNSDPKLIKPYPLIEDGEAFLVLPAHGQAGTKQAIRFKAPGIKWALSDPVLMYFGLSLSKLVAVSKRITEAGIQVTNAKDIQKAYRKLRRTKLRDPSEE